MHGERIFPQLTRRVRWKLNYNTRRMRRNQMQTMKQKCETCWLPINLGQDEHYCQLDFKESFMESLDIHITQYEDVGVNAEYMRQLTVDVLTKRSQFLADLESIRQYYTVGVRTYILDKNTTLNLLFECIANGDLTPFLDSAEMKKVKKLKADYMEDIKRNLENKKKEQDKLQDFREMRDENVLAKKTVKELRELLTTFSQSTAGKKQDLLNKLMSL